MVTGKVDDTTEVIRRRQSKKERQYNFPSRRREESKTIITLNVYN